jgi:hypothetical protein
MQEIDFGKINCSKENRDRRPLRFSKDVVDVSLMGHFLPQARGGSLSDYGITVNSTSDLKWRPVRPAVTEWRAVVVEVFIELTLEEIYQMPCSDKVPIAISASSVQCYIWAVSVQGSTPLETKQTPLCAKRHHMVLTLASVSIITRLAV